MIQSITIDNFRGIKHLEINGFRKVNLLVGKNGSGKSTVLESLLIEAFPTRPNALLFCNNQRFLDVSDWHYAFHNEADEMTLKVKDADDAEHCLHISRYEESVVQPSINTDSYYKKGMKFSYRQNGGEEYGAIFFSKGE